jgi:hypothetical protein
MENRRIKGSPPTCVFIGKRGSGKCLGRDTPILMYDGSIKMVQDIHIGDVIMGDDSCPRNVLALSSGESEMYKVIQTKGDDYVVNENHVLSLKAESSGSIIDIPIEEYLRLAKLSKTTEHFKGYKVIIKTFNPPRIDHIEDTEFSIEPLGVDNYYGFEVDGNHRFLLGDFTVTHNSTLISDIMYYHRTVPYGVIMSGTEDGNGFYGQYFPDLFIHSEFKSEALEKLIKQQKKCVKEETDPKRGHVFLLIDDLMYDKKMIRDKNMRQIFMNGRHWRILFFLSMQYCMDLPPDMRTNIDFVFLLRENIVANQMKLWKNFCGIFPTFQSFQETFTACTENYECLVLDNTSKSNKIEDCVFWYKGVQNREYRIGSKQLWDFAKTHYNKNYDKEENESAVNDPIKKQSGLNIIKKGNKAADGKPA